MNDQDNISYAPWTDEEVWNLLKFQTFGASNAFAMHPFTCSNHNLVGDKKAVDIILIPTNSGWICPDRLCDYTQNWAHDFMANGEALKNIVESMEQDRTKPWLLK